MFVKLSLDQVIDRAGSVLVATVGESRAEREDIGGHVRISTRQALLDVDVVHGAPATAATAVRTAGGKVGDTAMFVPGMPTLSPGERYVLFLRAGPETVFPFVGGPQGIYRVRRGPATAADGRAAAPQLLDYAGRPVTGIVDGEVQVGEPGSAGLGLADFLAYIAARKGANLANPGRPSAAGPSQPENSE